MTESSDSVSAICSCASAGSLPLYWPGTWALRSRFCLFALPRVGRLVVPLRASSWLAGGSGLFVLLVVALVFSSLFSLLLFLLGVSPSSVASLLTKAGSEVGDHVPRLVVRLLLLVLRARTAVKLCDGVVWVRVGPPLTLLDGFPAGLFYSGGWRAWGKCTSLLDYPKIVRLPASRYWDRQHEALLCGRCVSRPGPVLGSTPLFSGRGFF